MSSGDTNKKIITAISFAVLIVLIILVNVFSLNGMKSWEIFASYPNLLIPTRYTYLIWGFIYLLLAMYTVYQLDLFPMLRSQIKKNASDHIRISFIISILSNIVWVFAWHYDYIALSLMLIITMLICLIYINREMSLTELSKWDKILIRLPFSIYYAWISIATVLNVTILFVSIGWKGFGLSDTFWTILVMIGVFVIATVQTYKNKDLAYGFSIICAYCLILVKHISARYLGGQYPEIVITSIACIILLTIGEGYLYLSKKKRG